jgi:hypothetical protein
VNLDSSRNRLEVKSFDLEQVGSDRERRQQKFPGFIGGGGEFLACSSVLGDYRNVRQHSAQLILDTARELSSVHLREHGCAAHQYSECYFPHLEMKPHMHRNPTKRVGPRDRSKQL